MKYKKSGKIKRSQFNTSRKRRHHPPIKIEEDYLSSLPDFILIKILSLLGTETAATTSVLLRRWRNLWTAVNSVQFTDFQFLKNLKWPTILHILHQLTSPNLLDFYLFIEDFIHCELPIIRSCFRLICDRNVEVINVVADELLDIPACVLTCQSLVRLELDARLKFELPHDGIIRLPNLRTLCLVFNDDDEGLMRSLVKSCPLLEDLDLGFNLDVDDCFMDITGLNLKKINIEVRDPSKNNRIVINALKLVALKVTDHCSFYYSFIETPTGLVEANIDLTYTINFLDWVVGPDYFREIAKFVGGLCYVRKLHLESKVNMFSYLNSMEDGVVLPVFRNLEYFVTTLDDLIGWKDLLITLQRFPNLKLLEVKMVKDYVAVEKRIWCAPECVPDCLLSKMKKISIKGFRGTENEIKLFEYILINANAMEELVINVVATYEESEESILWKEYKFTEALFKLQKRSFACKVLFFGYYISASSDAFVKQSTLLRCVLRYST